MKYLVLCLVSLSLLVTSCKKSKDKPAPTKENIAGTYKLTAHMGQITGQPDENYYTDYEPCSKDDLYNFLLSGLLEIREGAVSCVPPVSGDLDWSVTSTTITIDGETFDIENFDGSELKIKVYESSVGGVTEKEFVTFTKQ